MKIDIEKLKKLKMNGLSVDNIASELGLERSTVIWKLKSLGLTKSNIAWDDSDIEKLKELKIKGHSADQIANELGKFTKNAVLGKLHRLGLSEKKLVSKEVTRAKQVRAGSTRRHLTKKQNVIQSVKNNDEALKKFITPPELNPVPYEDVTGCMWPYGDNMPYTYCNAETLDKRAPYCSYHTNEAGAMYRKSPRVVSVRRTNW